MDFKQKRKLAKIELKKAQKSGAMKLLETQEAESQGTGDKSKEVSNETVQTVERLELPS